MITVPDCSLTIVSDSLSNCIDISVTVNDPVRFYGYFENAGLFSSVDIASAAVVKLKPSGLQFSFPSLLQMRLYRPPRNDEEVTVLCGSHKQSKNEKTRLVWEDVTSYSTPHHHFENISISIYHFCWYLVIYKKVLLQTKTLLSRLNLISFKYHMAIFIRRDYPQESHIDLRVVFASSDVFRETMNSELELSAVKSLRELGFELISEREGTYVYEGQALNVLIKPGGHSELVSGEKGSKEIAVDKTWWSDGKDFQFTLHCEEGSSFASGCVEVHDGDNSIEENFKADGKQKININCTAANTYLL